MECSIPFPRMTDAKFTQLTDCECALLFEALLFCIESNSGIGFRSECQNRIEYEAGKTGNPVTETEDSETTNKMFQMLHELSLHLADSREFKLYHRRYGITTWREFCEKAVKAAEGRRRTYVPLSERPGYYGPA